MDTLAAVSLSDKLILSGIGFILGGILAIVGIKVRLIPGHPLKWGIAIISLFVGIVLITLWVIKR